MSKSMPLTVTGVLRHQVSLNAYVLQANMHAVTHSETLRQPRLGGNCFNWILGHVLASRNLMLTGSGREMFWGADKSARYEQGSDPITEDGDGVLDFKELTEAFDASQDTIYDMLTELTEAELSRAAPFSPTGSETETVASLLAGLVFHESYHVGQIGLIRRVVGLTPRL